MPGAFWSPKAMPPIAAVGRELWGKRKENKNFQP